MILHRHLRTLCVGLCWVVCSSFGLHAAQPTNVLLIVVDDLRQFGGAYTRELVQTPHIDRLRARGVNFTRAYVQYPVCNPSRTSFLTGLRCEQTGVTENTQLFRQLLPDVVTLPQHLRSHGWRTESYGKIFHVGEQAGEVRSGWMDEARSWDRAEMFRPTELGRTGDIRALAPGELRWCEVGRMNGGDDDQPDGQNAAAAVAALDRFSTAGQPWLLAVGFHKPHDPFLAPRQYFDLYPRESLTLYTDPTDATAAPPLAIPKVWHATFAKFSRDDQLDFLQAYCAGTSFMDVQVGRVLDALDRHALWDSTLVVLVGDHGYHHGERGWWNKNTLFDRSCNAPLVVAAPGAAAGRTSTALVEFVDLYPTVIDYCKLQPPHAPAGRSLRPVLEAPEQSHQQAAFTLVTRGPAAFGQSVRTDRWRCTRWSDGAVELYDHSTDPDEMHNVAEQPEHQDVRRVHLQLLDTLPPFRR